MRRQHLIFDADDTLWENNIYFEQAFDSFCEYLSHSSMTPQQIRGVLDEIEKANTILHGYGAKSYARNLTACFEHVAERGFSDADRETIENFVHEILNKPIELLEGVAETLAQLAERHELTMFTKGDLDEQKMKIDRSGLADYFHHTAIVKEKNVPAYEELARQRGFDRAKAWMIGNSPKSDVNPALEAGLSAVYVPHPRTWSLERETVPAGHPRLLRIERITELTRYF